MGREQDGTPYKAPVRNAVYASDPVIQAPETRSPSKQRSPSRQYDRVVQKEPIRRRSRSVSPQQGPGVGRGKGVQVHEERSASRSPSYKRDEKRREEVQPHHDYDVRDHNASCESPSHRSMRTPSPERPLQPASPRS